jgi:GntR family transcriptional regulator/MocR family aminotransferase
MPATRAFAADLGLARSTVTECYSELVAEGWLVARQGSGTTVAQLGRPAEVVSPKIRAGAGERVVHALVPGAADFADFPRQQWLASARRAFASAPYSAFGYGDPAGSIELRSALADYLARARGVRADAEQIVIWSGFHHGLVLMARALSAQGAHSIAVESYGLNLYREVLVTVGLDIPPLRVDEQGAHVEDLADVRADAVLLTPAHQFPTGVALSPTRRTEALDWARRAGRLILEDDYDGEFRYDRAPVGALQGLDPDRVVYFGSASKSVAPALRMGWIVVPKTSLPAVLAAKGSVDTVSVLEQLTLADFITSGAFDRNVRSRRQRYRRRREQLITALSDTPQVRIIGMSAGLQAVIALPRGTEGATLQAAAARGLLVSGMAEYRHPAADPSAADDGLVVNFSAISDSAWSPTLELLRDALRVTAAVSSRPSGVG